MANPIFSQNMIADFFRTDSLPEYVLDSALVENTTGAAVQLEGLPYPVKVGTGAGFVEVMTETELAADTEAMLGFLVTNRHEELAATTGVSMAEYAVLKRGPAVVDSDNFVVADLTGATYTVAELQAFCDGTRAAGNANPLIKTVANAGLKSEPEAPGP